uniref:Secreted protein n=1 Tax=Setaria viridis TaxID=4556 RepID=A0A4U6U1Z6_SETVI|nr:hypothetical protein SEVIR_6G004250v2 [Setaria viridis]
MKLIIIHLGHLSLLSVYVVVEQILLNCGCMHSTDATCRTNKVSKAGRESKRFVFSSLESRATRVR